MRDISFRLSFIFTKARTKYHTSKSELSVWFIQLSYCQIHYKSIFSTHTDTHTHTYIYIYIYIYIYTHTHAHTLMYLSLSLSLYLSIYLSLSLYIYIYIVVEISLRHPIKLNFLITAQIPLKICVWYLDTMVLVYIFDFITTFHQKKVIKKNTFSSVEINMTVLKICI